MSAARPIITHDPRALAGKYLTFPLDTETYGIPVRRVQEIISLLEITMLPRLPAFVKGVVNLRGKIIPVVDLRAKFELPAREATRETCIIVVNTPARLCGLLVDTVSEVEDIQAAEVSEPPDLGFQVDTTYLLGVGRAKSQLQLLLNVDLLLSAQELSTLGQAATLQAIETE